MTKSQSKIPFHDLTFFDDLPKMRDVEARLKTFLEATRKRAQLIEIEEGRLAEEDRVYPYDLVGDADMGRTTRQQSLTDFGESYLEHCRDILEMVSLSEGKASDQHRSPLGRLRIAACAQDVL